MMRSAESLHLSRREHTRMNGRDDEMIRAYRTRVEQINGHESEMRAKSDEAMRDITDKLKARVQPIPEEASQPPGDQDPIPFRLRRSHKKDAPNDRKR